ncbi:MAG: hypothetical protein AAB785_00655 [Patescibacteria group bacterium]
MIKYIVKILAILMLVILQIAIISKIAIWGIIPNLILILSICLILRDRFEDGFLVALLGGLMMDLSSSLHFGLFTLIFLAILAVIYFYLLKFFPAPNWLTSLLIFGGSFLLLDLIISLLVGDWSWQEILKDIIINSLWGGIIYLIVQRIVQSKEEIKLT